MRSNVSISDSLLVGQRLVLVAVSAIIVILATLDNAVSQQPDAGNNADIASPTGAISSKPSTPFQPDTQGYADLLQPLLHRYCLHCHGPSDAQGELRIDTQLSTDFLDPAVQARWSEIANVLKGHAMPPEDQPQPSPDQVSLAIDWITNQTVRAEDSRKESKVVMRRLNRFEYHNTIRDLLGITFDVSSFPEDPAASGFDNNGSALGLSSMQLELYYQAAQTILDKALVVGERPATIRWRVEPESGNSDANRVRIDDQRPIVNGGNNEVFAGGVLMHHANWDRSISFRDFQLPHSGNYQVRIRAGGRIPNRDQVVDSAAKYWRSRIDQDLRENPQQSKWKEEEYRRAMDHFATDRIYDYGPPRLKITKFIGGQPKVIAEFDVAANLDQPQVFEFNTEFAADKTGIAIEYAYDIPKELENFWLQTGDDFERPEAWIDWIEIEGPVYDAWPPTSHQNLLQSESADNDEAIQSTVKRFMQRAYRRPVNAEEINDKIELYRAAREAGDNHRDALRIVFTSVLISPHFLFLAEGNLPVLGQAIPANSQLLSPYQIASRLSYFMWSSMPDDELFRLARRGQIMDPGTLSQQVDRMLADPRSDAFVDSFASQWLGLREIGANPPAPDLFRHYDRHLELSIRQESLAFFREVLQHDLSIRNFLLSDFVTINERLARFYGIDSVRGDHFRRVPLPKNVARGGVLTQASLLTITSNGTRTSPVKRGTWILKNILGDDPGLPVANVGEIAPTVPGTDRATVRQRLEIHRTLPQCARCHNRIDPLGFALENFDASGYYRDREGFGYQGRIQADDPLIDTTSKLPDGTSISGIRGLQQALVQREDAFFECLATKLMTYALGREVTLSDQPRIQALVNELKTEEPTLRRLIKSVVLSPEFRSK